MQVTFTRTGERRHSVGIERAVGPFPSHGLVHFVVEAAAPAWCARLTPERLGAPLLTRIRERLNRVAPRWHALPAGGEIALTWPFPEGMGRAQSARRVSTPVPRGRRWVNRAAARRG